MFPIGNMKLESPKDLGATVRAARRSKGLRQAELALAAGTGRRFVVDLEAGKPTVRLDEVLRVLQALGLSLSVEPADGAREVAWLRLN
jgi:HTH-type transcriptional regulator/antitoxin HipB